MNLYLISQTENRDYDTYDSAVVCAPDENAARYMCPTGDVLTKENWADKCRWHWCLSPDVVSVELLGKANKNISVGVVCASFHAG